MTWLTKTYNISPLVRHAVAGNVLAYHTTIAGPKILEEGFKTRSQLGTAALGGGADDAVSFTTEYSTAKGIFDAFILIWELANSSDPLSSISNHSASLDPVVYQQINQHVQSSIGSSLVDLVSGWKKTHWNMSQGPLTTEELNQNGFKPVEDHEDGDERHFVWQEPISSKDIDDLIYSYVTSYLTFAPVYNPLFFGSSTDYFRNISRENIGIITVELYLDPKTKGKRNDYENSDYYVLPSMSEIRVRNLANIDIVSFDANPTDNASMSSTNLTYNQDENLHNDLNKILKTIYKHRDIFDTDKFEFDHLVGIFQDIDDYNSLAIIQKQIYALIGIDYSQYDLDEYVKIKKRMEPDPEISNAIKSLPSEVLAIMTNGEASWEDILDNWYESYPKSVDIWYGKINHTVDREIEWWLSDYRWNKPKLDKIIERLSPYHPVDKIDDFAEIHQVFQGINNKNARNNVAVKISQAIEDNIDWHNIDYDTKYPIASASVDGLIVRDEIPNTESISASLYHYDQLPGIRQFPMSDLGSGNPYDVFYAKDDIDKSFQLAEAIKRSQEISPLIIVIDDNGPYILEGAHRFAALYLLGVMHFPALIIIDQAD